MAGAPIRLFITGEGELSSTPLAMAMYTVAVTALIRHLRQSQPDVSQVWFADDATAAGQLTSLFQWWRLLLSMGPLYGYFPNSVKTYHDQIVKSDFYDAATMTCLGQWHLGAAIGTRSFTEEYVSKKVKSWCDEILTLSIIAKTHPHSAYGAFILQKWNYVMCTIESVGSLFQPLEDVLHQHFITALTGCDPRSEVEQELLALPCRLGGLNIPNPTTICEFQFSASKKLGGPLASLILRQSDEFSIPSLHSEIRHARQLLLTANFDDVKSRLDSTLQWTMDLLRSKCSSNWLTALPIQEQGFHLNKQELWDALCLRYGWQLSNVPDHCVCGSPFSADHAMIC